MYWFDRWLWACYGSGGPILLWPPGGGGHNWQRLDATLEPVGNGCPAMERFTKQVMDVNNAIDTLLISLTICTKISHLELVLNIHISRIR